MCRETNRFVAREQNKDNGKWHTQVRKRKKGSSGNYSGSFNSDSFVNLSSANKLVRIFDQLNRNFSKLRDKKPNRITV